jgi:hypothetical protein
VAEKHNATPAQVHCEHILYCISCPAFLVPSVSTRELDTRWGSLMPH